MPYISELLNNTITDNTDAVVGKLTDILISPKEGTFPPLEFLVIKGGFGQGVSYVPYEFVSNFTSRQIALKNQFSKIALTDVPPKPYVYLRKDILDKQIVDVAGTRVVRVNDLRIGVFDNKMCVLGIDPSVRGLFRRLGIEGKFWDKLFKVNLIDWRQAQLVEGQGPVQLNTMAENLSQLHPADLANIVEDLDVMQGSNLLSSLDEREAAKVFEELDPHWQTILVKYLGPEKASRILSQVSVDELVDLAKTFTTREARKFLSKIKPGQAQAVQKLLAYPDNTAGGLMTLDFLTARPEWTVARTIEEVKQASDSLRSIVYIYVTDQNGKFVGVVSLRRLLTGDPGAVITKVAKPLADYATLRPDDKMDKIIELMTRYNLYTAAVLDSDKKLAGVVTIDDVMRQLYPAA